jgi:hypothetical protein
METEAADKEDSLYFVCLLISFAKGCRKLIYYKVKVFKLLPFSNIYYTIIGGVGRNLVWWVSTFLS